MILHFGLNEKQVGDIGDTYGKMLKWGITSIVDVGRMKCDFQQFKLILKSLQMLVSIVNDYSEPFPDFAALVKILLILLSPLWHASAHSLRKA